jgi:2-polyprenyl-3-methyl-5-hydroxy-6-metoxy-1,4-benzoquinol methylase
MIKQEVIEQAESIKWFHSIKLFDDYTTKGVVGQDHCGTDVITSRFGMPVNLTGKTVLDVGVFDGVMAFEAEKRGAIVTGIDPLQGCSHIEQGTKGFYLAKQALNSNVTFLNTDIESYWEYSEYPKPKYSIVLLYGTLYHVTEPIKHLQAAFNMCEEFVLIETAISPEIELDGKRLANWQFRHGFDGDPTNKFYPNITGLTEVLRYIGFPQVELIYMMPDGIRATVKAIK